MSATEMSADCRVDDGLQLLVALPAHEPLEALSLLATLLHGEGEALRRLIALTGFRRDLDGEVVAGVARVERTDPIGREVALGGGDELALGGRERR